MTLRRLGQSDLEVSSVALGCWPISGMTSVGVTVTDSLATLREAVAQGINFFDTAFCYGAAGESECLVGEALAEVRAQVVIATKGGIHWGPARERVFDATPERLRTECETSLRRLRTDYVDLLFLHAPDPRTPLRESAGALLDLQQQGKTRAVGVSNVSLTELQAFHAVCPVAAVQPPYNMLMREIERDLIPWCIDHQVAVVPYWPLMKGLLAGKLARDHVFAEGDGRPKYAMFQGEEWERNQDLLDELRQIAADTQTSIADLVIRWTIAQPGITSALCGAKRPEQIRETAHAMRGALSVAQQEAIDRALARRGEPRTESAVPRS